MKEKLSEVIENDLIKLKAQDMYMDIQTYHYLTLSEKNANEPVEAFMNLIDAIKRPALSVEVNRFLMYSYQYV